MSAALAHLHEHAGAPTRGHMERRARAAGRALSGSTAHRLVTRQQIPHTQVQLQTLLLVCDVPLGQWPVWEQAWIRARRTLADESDRKATRLAELEAAALGDGSARFTSDVAIKRLHRTNFEPMEPYRAFDAPWTVRCRRCGAVRRLRLSDVVATPPSCPECAPWAARRAPNTCLTEPPSTQGPPAADIG